MPSLNKQKILELARGEWIDQHFNCCLIGNAGTGKTHLAIALGLAACRQGRRVRFFTAAALVNQLEEAQKQYHLDRLLTPTGQDRPADLRRTGLPVLQPHRRRTAVPGLRRPLRAGQPVDHQQPGLQRLGPDLPGRTDDRGPAGPADAPLPHLRDERRELPLPGVDEIEEAEEVGAILKARKAE